MFIPIRLAGKRYLQRIITAIITINLLVIPLINGKAASINNISNISLPSLEQGLHQTQSISNTPIGQSVDLLGQWGGTPHVIQVKGSYAYVGFGTQFDILDISNPSQIQRMGWLATAGDVIDISIDGNLVFIAYRGKYRGNFGPTGIQVVDISHPELPVLLTSLEIRGCGSFPTIITSDETAFFAYSACSTFGGIIQNAGAFLKRLDISDPANPIVIAEFSIPMGTISGLAFGNDQVYAIFNDPNTTLKVFGTSSPSELIETGSTPVSSYAQGIALAGNHAFLAAGVDGIQRVDISDPSNPIPADADPLMGEAQKIDIEGTSAIIGTNTSQIVLLDIANPLDPNVLGVYDTSGQPTDIDIVGSTGYSINSPSGVEVFDIASLSQIGLERYPQDVSEVFLEYPYVYLAAADGFWVQDVSNPGFPTLQAHLATPQPAVALVLKDEYVYVGQKDGSMWVVDISNPTSPVKAGEFPLSIELKKMALIGDLVYAAAGASGLYILDISNPLAPQQIGSFTPTYEIVDIAAAETMVYLAADNGNLVVVNVANPDAPEEVGIYNPIDSYSGDQSATSVTVQNNIAYLTTIEPPPTPLAGFYSGDVWLINVTKPEAPTLVHRLTHEFGWAPWDISLDNERATIVYQRQGLYIYDFTDLSAPVEIGFYNPPEYIRGVTHWGDQTIFFGDNVYLIRYIDPGLPSINGLIIQPNHQPKPGVRVSTGDPIYDDITNLQGVFSLQGLPGGTYTITPSLSGCVFSPDSLTANIPPSAEEQIFTILAAPISGSFIPGTDLTLEFDDTQGLPTRLEIPGDALSISATIGLVPIDAKGEPGHSFTGHAFELNVVVDASLLEDTTFYTPVTLTIQYSANDTRVISDVQSLELWRWDGSAWQDASQTCSLASEYWRDIENNTISLPVCMSGVYKLVGDTYQVTLSMMFRDK